MKSRETGSRRVPDEVAREAPRPTRAIEALFSEYVDLLNAGTILDYDEIRARHPDVADELLEQLEDFERFGSGEGSSALENLGTLGDFVLRRQIGRGGMGIVYEAWQTSMKRQVALKVLPAGIAADPKACARFMREAQAAGKLHHQNVVTVHAMGVDEHTPYYAMDFVEGETLARVLERLRSGGENRSPAEERTLLIDVTKLFHTNGTSPGANGSARAASASNGSAATDGSAVGAPAPAALPHEVDLKYCVHVAEAFAGVADGLQHAHARGVIHRDIKPSNLILDRECRLRILDFGLARFEGQETLTMSGDLIGTVLYMSPEQAMAKRIPLDHRTDIYSLGATLYEMLAWRPPFRGGSTQETLSQIVLDEPASLSRENRRVPKDLETIVLKCLRKNPGDRYGTAEALAQDLRRFVRGDPIEARPQSRWERIARHIWRHRLRLAAALMTLLFLGSVALLGLAYRQRVQEERSAEYGKLILGAVGRLEGRFADHFSQKDSKRESAEAYLLGESPLAATRRRIATVIEQLQVAVELFPDRPEAYYYRARALLELQREDDALKELDLVERVDPDFVPAATLRDALYERLRKPPARSDLDTDAWSAADPWARAWHRGQTAFRNADWAEAEAAYGELIRMDERQGGVHAAMSLEVRMGRGIARLELGEYERATRDFATACDRWPTALSPGLMLGYSYLFQGGAEGTDIAQQWFEEFFARFAGEDGETRDEAALAIVTTFLAWGDEERALAWLDRVRPGPLRRRSRILLLVRRGDTEEAAEVARTIPEDEQDDPVLLAFAALALSQRGECSTARSFLGRAETIIQGSGAAPALQMAEAYFNAGEMQSAVEWAGRAFVSDPRNVAACNSLAWCLFNSGQTAAALDVCRECVRLAPESVRVHQVLSACYLRLGRVDEADAAARRALEFAEEWSPSANVYARAIYYFARIHERRGDLDAAEEYYRKAVAASDGRQFQTPLAVVLMAKGKYDEALEVFSDRFRAAGSSGRVEGISRKFSALLRGGARPENLEPLREIARIVEGAVDDSAMPWLNEAHALLLLHAPGREDPQRAVKYAERALFLAGESIPEYLITLASAHAACGDPRAAIRALERGVGITPKGWLENFADLQTILEQHRAAFLPALASFDSVDAILARESDSETLQHIFEAHRDSGAARAGPAIEPYFRGRLLQRQGLLRDAVRAFESAFELDPAPAPRLRLAAVLMEIGDHDAARAYLGDAFRGRIGEEELLWSRWSAAAGQRLFGAFLPLADSFFDWSTGGVQGHRGWFSGYYNRTFDPGGTYDASDFVAFENAAGPEGGPVEPGGNHWTGSRWNLHLGGAPWTGIGQESVHSGSPEAAPGEEHWVVRRWVSDRNAALTVTWSVRKIAIRMGNGATAHLFHNGAELDSVTIAVDDSVGVERSLDLDVSKGDTIDLALDPTGTNGTKNGHCDRCATRLTITSK